MLTRITRSRGGDNGACLRVIEKPARRKRKDTKVAAANKKGDNVTAKSGPSKPSSDPDLPSRRADPFPPERVKAGPHPEAKKASPVVSPPPLESAACLRVIEKPARRKRKDAKVAAANKRTKGDNVTANSGPSKPSSDPDLPSRRADPFSPERVKAGPHPEAKKASPVVSPPPLESAEALIALASATASVAAKNPPKKQATHHSPSPGFKYKPFCLPIGLPVDGSQAALEAEYERINARLSHPALINFDARRNSASEWDFPFLAAASSPGNWIDRLIFNVCR